MTAYKVVPVRVLLQQSGQYTFRGLDMWYFDSTATVLLEDAQISTLHNLSTNAVYQFQATAGEDTARFKLHFLPGAVTGIVDGQINDARELQLDIYPNPTKSYFVIEYTNAGANQHMELYNMQGQAVWSGTTEAISGEVRVQTDRLPAGVYVLRIATKNGMVGRKIVVSD